MRTKSLPERRQTNSAQFDMEDSPARPLRDILTKIPQIKLHKLTSRDIAEYQTQTFKPRRQTAKSKRKAKSDSKVKRLPAKPRNSSQPGPIRQSRYSVMVYDGDKAKPVCVVLPSTPTPLKVLKPMPTIYQGSNEKLRITSHKPTACSILCKMCGQVIDPFKTDKHSCVTVLETSIKDVVPANTKLRVDHSYVDALQDETSNETENAVEEIVIEDVYSVSVPVSPASGSDQTSIEDETEVGSNASTYTALTSLTAATSSSVSSSDVGANKTETSSQQTVSLLKHQQTMKKLPKPPAPEDIKLVKSALSMLKKTPAVNSSKMEKKYEFSTDGSISLFSSKIPVTKTTGAISQKTAEKATNENQSADTRGKDVSKSVPVTGERPAVVYVTDPQLTQSEISEKLIKSVRDNYRFKESYGVPLSTITKKLGTENYRVLDCDLLKLFRAAISPEVKRDGSAMYLLNVQPTYFPADKNSPGVEESVKSTDKEQQDTNDAAKLDQQTNASKPRPKRKFKSLLSTVPTVYDRVDTNNHPHTGRACKTDASKPRRKRKLESTFWPVPTVYDHMDTNEHPHTGPNSTKKTRIHSATRREFKKAIKEHFEPADGVGIRLARFRDCVTNCYSFPESFAKPCGATLRTLRNVIGPHVRIMHSDSHMYILNMKCREKFHIGKLTSKSLSAVSAVSRITKEPVKTALPHTNTSPKQNQTPQKLQGQDKLAQDTVQHQLASTQSTTKTLDKQEKNAIHHQLTPSDIETDAFDYLQNEIQHHQQTPTAMETDVIDDQTDGYTSAEAGQSSAGNKNPPYTRTDANVSSYKTESDAVRALFKMIYKYSPGSVMTVKDIKADVAKFGLFLAVSQIGPMLQLAIHKKISYAQQSRTSVSNIERRLTETELTCYLHARQTVQGVEIDKARVQGQDDFVDYLKSGSDIVVQMRRMFPQDFADRIITAAKLVSRQEVDKFSQNDASLVLKVPSNQLDFEELHNLYATHLPHTTKLLSVFDTYTGLKFAATHPKAIPVGKKRSIRIRSEKIKTAALITKYIGHSDRQLSAWAQYMHSLLSENKAKRAMIYKMSELGDCTLRSSLKIKSDVSEEERGYGVLLTVENVKLTEDSQDKSLMPGKQTAVTPKPGKPTIGKPTTGKPTSGKPAPGKPTHATKTSNKKQTAVSISHSASSPITHMVTNRQTIDMSKIPEQSVRRPSYSIANVSVVGIGASDESSTRADQINSKLVGLSGQAGTVAAVANSENATSSQSLQQPSLQTNNMQRSDQCKPVVVAKRVTVIGQSATKQMSPVSRCEQLAGSKVSKGKLKSLGSTKSSTGSQLKFAGKTSLGTPNKTIIGSPTISGQPSKPPDNSSTSLKPKSKLIITVIGGKSALQKPKTTAPSKNKISKRIRALLQSTEHTVVTIDKQANQRDKSTSKVVVTRKRLTDVKPEIAD